MATGQRVDGAIVLATVVRLQRIVARSALEAVGTLGALEKVVSVEAEEKFAAALPVMTSLNALPFAFSIDSRVALPCRRYPRRLPCRLRD